MNDAVEVIKQRAEELIAEAVQLGVVVTISLQPLQPLAMGNHQMVVEVSPKHPY